MFSKNLVRTIANAFLLVALCCTTAAQAQLVAFPGAEGAGKYTTGGRGTATTPTTVFEVTSLGDDNVPGTLRYALTAAATYRTVVFRVSGTIHLNSKLTIRANTTLAGQTAPGDGICVADHPVVISGDNVIVRYMRFRLGDRYQNKGMVDGSGSDDALGALGASNVIIDHCSVSWSTDEALTIYRGDNLTIQWSMISEPLNYSYHFEAGGTDYQQHGYGGIWGAKRGSMHHNLIAHARNRMPRFAGISTYTPNTVGVENVDFRNNVIYNWGINNIYGGDGGNYNIVNNYFKYGPNTSTGVRYRICNPSKSDTDPYGKWYVDGNYVFGSSANTADNWLGVTPDGGTGDIPTVKATTAFDLGYPLPVETAQQAYESVLQDAGCTLPNRDTLDQRIANDVRNGTGRIIDVQGGYPHGTAYAQTVNAWPALRSTAPLADDDRDGMPNSWETANGLDPANAADRNTAHSSGYTMLEVYLNSITNTNPRIEAVGSLSSFSQVLGTPSATQTFTVSAASLGSALTVAPPAFYEVSVDGTTWFGSANPLVLTATNGTVAATTITVRLNATTAGVYNNSIRLTSTGASDVVVAVNGTASAPGTGVGSFPEMDGGFEKQTVGTNTTIASNTAQTSTTDWASNSSFKIEGTNARTGGKYMKWNQASTSNKYIFTPLLTTNPLQPNAPYVVQFWYRTTDQLTANLVGTDLQLYGWATVTGASGGTNIALTPALTLNTNSPYGPEWRLFTGVLTSPNLTPTSTYAGIRVTKPQVPYFDIDDFVVYAGTAADAAAPDAASAPVATANLSGGYITVSWTAPTTGVDGGGYMVVRSTSATAPTPNANGVYVVGNTVSTGGEVIYIGPDATLTDVAVAQGTTYYYHIFTLDKAYNYSAATTVSGSLSAPPPALTATGTLSAFAQTVGIPSATQTYSLSGTNLTGNVTITPPAGYEVSANGGTSWATASAPLVLTPSSGSVAATTITVRLNATAAGSYSGNITHTSGTASADVSVTGTATAPVVTTTTGVLQHWPLTTNAQDSAGARAAGVTASTPTFNKLYSSNNTTVVNSTSGLTLPPYSGKYGQAFGASASGDGSWAAPNGPGGSVNRTFYEQFVLTPESGFTARLDSVRFTAAFYNTSNGRIAVAYSRSGFTAADSVDLSGASFATPITGVNQTGGPTTEYAFALAGTEGVSLAAGESLTVRFYFAAGTTSVGRYAMLKDVKLIGTATGSVAPPPAAAITTTGTLTAFSQTVGTPSAAQTYTVAGANLTGNLTVTPPASYEVSNNGTVWYTATSPLVLTPTGGAVANTSISVRLNAATAGTYAGNITHTSTGATAQAVAVSGSATTPVVVTPPPVAYNVIVARDGSGNYTTVQAAIDAAPTGRTTPYVIYIRNGKYKEKITIPSNKPFIHLIGESVANVILTYDDYSGKAMPGGGTYGTANSASVTVNANDCFFANITFENTTGDAPQALAINVGSDRVVLVNCRFLGGQDTVLAYNSGRSYFKNCYIDGTVDFIFGNGKTVFDSTLVYAKTRQDGLSGSYITAANTPQGQTYGFVFRDCVIPSNFGTTSYVLGRPWQNDGSTTTPAHNKTVFINTTMGNSIIKPEGWSTWSSGTVTSVIYYGEYRSRKFDSSLIDVSARAPWSYQLTADEAATYTNANIFGTWDPASVSPLVNNSPAREIAVSNFKAKKGTSTTPSLLRWNISWPMTGITYELFRSSDNVTFSKINEQTAVNDTAVNFSYSEAIPPAGATYYYYVRASKSGLAPHITDTVLVSSTPTITVSGTLGSFKQGVGTPSAVQAYTVSGVNLTNAVTITPPAGYEVSANNGTDWYSTATPLVLNQTGGVLASTTISVRLNAATAGSYTGNIVHTSTGAAAINQAVNGTVQTDPLPPPAVVLQHWPLTANNGDSAAVRSAGVVATTPTFNNFYISNGTTVTSVPAYSPLFGQAFGPGRTGNALWTTTTGANGSILNRTFYEQFTITASQGYTVRVDSLVLSSAFYGSSSGTKVAVVYSKSGFATDSADVTGGTGPAGALLSTANGAFATPIALANQNTGVTNTYTLALADANGVTLAAGETLTVRLYYACGSTSEGRYALLKDVKAKGLAMLPPVLNTASTMGAFTQALGTPSATQTFKVWGSNLQTNVTITPPAGYEVSADGGTTWSNSTTPLVIRPVEGTLAEKVITVRLNATTAGTYAGNITTTGSGLEVNVGVTGTTATSTLTTTGTLTAFSQIVGTPSAVQTYTVSGTTLTGAVTITPPAAYQVSSDGGATWFSNTAPLVLNPTNGTLATTTISVRLNATATGTFSGNINNSTPGATTRTVAVTGITLTGSVTASGTLQPFVQVGPTPSAVQTYTVSGVNLSAGLTVTPPAGYEVSADGGATWFGNTTPLVLPSVNGALAATTISVRLKAAQKGDYAGTITHTAVGENKASVAVTGKAIVPAVTLSAGLQPFSQTVGTPSVAQSYTVGGTELAGAITITPPAGYEVSVDGKTWSTAASPLLIQPVNGTVAATRIQVRQHAAVAGTYSGVIAITTSGHNALQVEVNGVAYPAFSISPNPTSGVLNIYHPKIYTIASLNIYTLTGVKLATYRTQTSTNVTSIDVSGLPAGVYYVEYLKLGERTLLKFIKQ